MTREIVCRQCSRHTPERESFRLSITPERVDPSGELTFVRQICACCAKEILGDLTRRNWSNEFRNVP